MLRCMLRHTRRTLDSPLAVLLIGIFGLVVLLIWGYSSPANQFMRGYRSLQVGATPAEVEHLLRRAPDHECRYRGYRIRYYLRPTPLAFARDRKSRSEIDSVECEVTTLSDLPYLYAAAEVAFDDRDRAVAWTLIGETSEIVTAPGRFEGDRLKYLGDAFFPVPRPGEDR